MTLCFGPKADPQQLPRTTVPPPQPHAPRRCPVPAPSRIAHAPGVSPRRPRAGTHPRNVPWQRDVGAASPRGHHHGRSRLPVGAGHPQPSSPSSPRACPIWLLSPIRRRHRQHHGGSGSLRDVRSRSPTVLLVSFVTAEIRSNMRRELHVRLALFSPAVAISGLSCSQTG